MKANKLKSPKYKHMSSTTFNSSHTHTHKQINKNVKEASQA